MMKAIETPIAMHKQRTTGRLPLFIVLLIALNISMSVMLASILSGMPFIVSMLLFLGSVYLVVTVFLQRAVYSFDNKGLLEQVSPFYSNFTLRKSREEYNPWRDLEYYTDGSDLTRGRWERPFLKLKFKGQRALQIYPSYNENVEEFIVFSKAFLKVMEELPQSAGQNGLLSNTPQHKAIRKPSFYERPIAKLIAVFFMFLTALIIAFAILYRKEMNVINFWRIGFVLVPVTIYMMYRAFTGRES